MLKRFALLLVLALPGVALAVPSGTAIQCDSVNPFSGTTRTLNSGTGWATPSSGNILVIGLASRANVTITPISWPSGFSTVGQDFSQAGNDAGMQGSVQLKISDGTESTLTVTMAAAPSNATFFACEFPSTDLDTSRIDAVQVVTTYVNSSTTSVTGAVTNTEDNAVIYSVTMPRRGNAFDGTSYSGTFTEQYSEITGSSALGVRIATDVVSSQASQSVTVSSSDIGDPLLQITFAMAEAPVGVSCPGGFTCGTLACNAASCPGDSLVIAGYSAADTYAWRFVSGAGSCNDYLVCAPSASPSLVGIQINDGSWSSEVQTNLELPPSAMLTEDASSVPVTDCGDGTYRIICP